MGLEVNLKNKLVSANNMHEENTLVFYDSDGEFIGDIYLDETVYPTDVGALLAELFFNTEPDPEKICEALAAQFFSIEKIIPNASFYELRKKYGDEWVNRIGKYALIVKEQ